MSNHAAGRRCSASVRFGFSVATTFFESTYYYHGLLAYCGSVLIENRNGLVVDTELVLYSGTAERDAALEMAGRIDGDQSVTVGADKGYDTRGFVEEMRDRNVTPHVSQNTNRSGGSAIDGRTTRPGGYQVSQRKRKRIEEGFGWLKTGGMLRK